MVKGIVIGIAQTEGMSGYSAALLVLSNENLNLLKRLRSTFQDVKDIDPNVGKVGYFLNPLEVILLNDDFSPESEVYEDKPVVCFFTDEEIAEYTEERDCAVNSPSLDVTEDGIRLFWDSKYVAGEEAWATANFDALDELIKSQTL